MIRTKDILARLKLLRLAKGIRQEFVARVLGVDRTTYVRKEKGVIPITTEEWLKLAEATDVEPTYFFSLSERPATQIRVKPNEAPVLELLRALTGPERSDLFAVLRLVLKGIRRTRVKKVLAALPANCP